MYQNDTVNDTYVSETHDEPVSDTYVSETHDEPVSDTYVSETHDEVEEIKIGLVSNCKKLNVREKPTVEASVVCEIVCGTELMIDEKESTEEFYKVCTAAGIEGFCMKKFIAIQP